MYVIFNYKILLQLQKKEPVNKLILIMCMNSHTTLYISHFLYFLSVCCTARRPNAGRLHTVNIIGKPDIVNPGHQAWLTTIIKAYSIYVDLSIARSTLEYF